MTSYLQLCGSGKVRIADDDRSSFYTLSYEFVEPTPAETATYEKWMSDTFPNKENYKKFLDALSHGLMNEEQKEYVIYGIGNNSKSTVTKLIGETFNITRMRAQYPDDFAFKLGSAIFTHSNFPNANSKRDVIPFEACWTREGPLITDPHFIDTTSSMKGAFLKAIVAHINGELTF